MKNALLGTAALALALSAGAASAQVETTSSNLSFGLGGFLTVGLGYVDTDDDNDETGLVRDGEIHFDGRLTADNGLTFGVDIEVELNGDENTDEASAFVQGSFGKFELGEQDGASSFMASGVVAPPFTSAQDGGGFLFNYYSGDMFDAGRELDSSGANTSDSLKVSYFTPSFSGFAAGVSYVPSTGDEGGNAVGRDSQSQGFEIGAGYNGDFGDFSFGLGGGYVTDATANNSDDSSWGVGGTVGFSGFTLGVNYGWEEEGINGGNDDQSTIGAGVTYGTGPWVFGVDFANVLEGADDGDLGVAAGMSYALAPGVSAGASIEYAEDDSSNREGFAAGAFLATTF